MLAPGCWAYMERGISALTGALRTRLGKKRILTRICFNLSCTREHMMHSSLVGSFGGTQARDGGLR